MKILLIPIGSSGDVHPFVGLGVALRRRGHQVTIVTNAHFEPLARGEGLDFEALGTEEDYRSTLKNPDLWDPRRGFALVIKLTLELLRPCFEIIARHHVPGETLVAAQVTAFGARVAQEVLGVPMSTVHLQPAVLRSVHAIPTLPGVPIGERTPPILKRAFFWFLDRAFIDPRAAPTINAFRAGVRPASGAADLQRVVSLTGIDPRPLPGVVRAAATGLAAAASADRFPLVRRARRSGPCTGDR